MRNGGRGHHRTGGDTSWTAFATLRAAAPDPLYEFQAMGIVVGPGGNGSRISENQISGRDVGVY
jgi:hypothetical protein